MDRENVIKGLGICYNDPPAKCGDCPYYKFDKCNDMLCLDALALLKEHEPTRPNKLMSDNGFRYDFCGNCGRLLPVAQDYKRAKYCPNCGNPVEWN